MIPADFRILAFPNFFQVTVGSTIALALRYLFWAGLAWILGYWLFKRRWLHRKIVGRFPHSREVWREVRYSALSMVIFAVVAGVTVEAARRGWTQLYWSISQHGWGWFW